MRNIIVYEQQPEHRPVPLTVNVDWLSDGQIEPRHYWTPDGSRFKVLHIYECVPMAYLKDRGEGLRYKVRAKLEETVEDGSDHPHIQFVTYLYFADNRYCEKTIVDARYAHAEKLYIPVNLDIFPNGDYELISFWCRDARYHVEQTMDISQRAAFRVGGVGLRHEVEARLVNADDDEDPDPARSIRRMAALYFEVNRWFVAVNSA